MPASRLARAALVAAAILTVGFNLGTNQPQESGWTIGPETAGIGWYDLALAPGEWFESAAVVSNHGLEPITLTVKAVTSITTMRGGFALGDDPAPDWFNFTAGDYIVAPAQALRIPFSLNIPVDLPPGDYGAGLVAYEAEPQEPIRTAGGLNVIPQSRIGFAVVTRVAGPGNCAIKILGAQIELEPEGQASILLTLANVGNVAFEGKGRLNVTSNTQPLFWSAPLEIDYSLPGEIYYPITAPMLPGEYDLSVEVHDSADPQCSASWSQTVNLAEPIDPGETRFELFETVTDDLGNSTRQLNVYFLAGLAALSLGLIGLVFLIRFVIRHGLIGGRKK